MGRGCGFAGPPNRLSSMRELSAWPQHLRTKLPAHHNNGMLGKAPLTIVGTKRSGATQVLQSILFYQMPHCRGSIGWRLSIGHPALKHLYQMARGDMLEFQPGLGEQGQERPEGEGGS